MSEHQGVCGLYQNNVGSMIAFDFISSDLQPRAERSCQRFTLWWWVGSSRVLNPACGRSYYIRETGQQLRNMCWRRLGRLPDSSWDCWWLLEILGRQQWQLVCAFLLESLKWVETLVSSSSGWMEEYISTPLVTDTTVKGSAVMPVVSQTIWSSFHWCLNLFSQFWEGQTFLQTLHLDEIVQSV